MDLSLRLSAEEQTQVSQFVHDYNSKLNPGRQPQQQLGKDDFLKLLITQLSHQDPTAPMQDKEFIAQMAQFSSLEQMTSMAADFARLANMLTGSEASSALGRNVELLDGEQVVQGSIKEITRGNVPQVLVNCAYYNWNQVQKVFDNE
jgi:flagellar basal-body rod modification protein FlgD